MSKRLLCCNEPDAILIVGGKQVSGTDRIRAALQSLLSGGAQMSLTTRSVIELREGIALLHGEWVVQRTTATEPQLRQRGISAEVVRKPPDGTWRFVIDNPDTPFNEQ